MSDRHNGPVRIMESKDPLQNLSNKGLAVAYVMKGRVVEWAWLDGSISICHRLTNAKGEPIAKA